MCAFLAPVRILMQIGATSSAFEETARQEFRRRHYLTTMEQQVRPLAFIFDLSDSRPLVHFWLTQYMC